VGGSREQVEIAIPDCNGLLGERVSGVWSGWRMFGIMSLMR
jgi:hypothetical protein